MRAGTIIKLPDGRIGTVCYHNLDGYGGVWGRQALDPKDPPAPEFMLRRPYPSASVDCVGDDYEATETPLHHRRRAGDPPATEADATATETA